MYNEVKSDYIQQYCYKNGMNQISYVIRQNVFIF
jgi:hypothetical protein